MKNKLLSLFVFIWMNLSIFSIVSAGEVYSGQGKRDPFVPLVTGDRAVTRGMYGVETLDDLVLEGVVIDAAHGSVAIVNGEIVHEGDVRDNIKVVKIQSNGVLFEINELQQFKPFNKDE
jgi:hypothetical protein